MLTTLAPFWPQHLANLALGGAILAPHLANLALGGAILAPKTPQLGAQGASKSSIVGAIVRHLFELAPQDGPRPILDQIWTDIGPHLDRFWTDVGSILY